MSDDETDNCSSLGMSNNSRFLYSTPIKASLRTGHSKPSASEERSYIRDPGTDLDFIATHFSSPTSPSLSVITARINENGFIQQLLLKLEKGSKEGDMYDVLARLFNKVAEIVSDDETMLFHPSKNIGPSGESRQEDRSLVPDFSILPPNHKFTLVDKHDTLRIPWSILESFVEVKTKKRSDHPQGIDYIETLLQYRPDKVFALGMTCNEHSYQFYYADACIQKSSPKFLWKDGLGELAQFIHTLHHNHKEDVGRDTSYTLHDVKWSQEINASARWRVSFHERTNEVQRMFARKGTGRRTWLGIGQGINDPFTTAMNTSQNNKIRIVKDMWRDSSRRFKESEVLDQIHKDGYIAGVVRHIPADAVNELTVKDSKKGTRIKEKVVMASTGLRLSACESVLDFLKVMYDLVETHEQLLESRGVLHRDISWYNVLCKPEHFTGDAKVIDHPTIGQLLGKQGKERESLCLLTDFDNASLTKEDNPGNAAERTGTPMFIACELSYGSSADEEMECADPITPNEFSLKGDVLEAYLKVYSKEKYHEYESWLQSVVSATGKKTVVATDSFIASHQPRHDMESVYWLILWFFIKAWPTAVELKHNTPDYGHNTLKNLMLTRQIGDTSQAVMIVPLLRHGRRTWSKLLNPVYEPLFEMLINMGQYLCMRWSNFPDIPPWHVHEAFKRLLFKEIFRMTNDNCPIPIQGPRPPPSKSASVKRSTTKAAKKGSQIPPQVAPSSHGTNEPEPQSVGSQKRPNSTTPDSAPPSKRPRRTGTANAVEDNSDLFALRIVENLANDAWWFV